MLTTWTRSTPMSTGSTSWPTTTTALGTTSPASTSPSTASGKRALSATLCINSTCTTPSSTTSTTVYHGRSLSWEFTLREKLGSSKQMPLTNSALDLTAQPES